MRKDFKIAISNLCSKVFQAYNTERRQVCLIGKDTAIENEIS